jgi:hypothetical protein
MTNNEALKADCAELLNKLKSFKKKYRIPGICDNGEVHVGSLSKFERDLRGILFVLRTDEENKEQDAIDRRL